MFFLDYDPWFTYEDVCTLKMQRSRTIGEHGLALLSNLDYWYAAAGNKLIRFHFSNNSEVVDWTEELEGEITALMFDFWKTQSRIFVATYDGIKGYIHEFALNEAKKELNAPLEVDGKVVSMCVAGDWKY